MNEEKRVFLSKLIVEPGMCGWGGRALVLALALAMGAGCGDDGGPVSNRNENINEQDGGVLVSEWDSPTHAYRVEVLLNAHPQRARTDVPVLAPLSHEGRFVERTVAVYEVVGGQETILVDSMVFFQPDGTVLEVAWTASGETPAGETRRFWVYYNVSAQSEQWRWQDGADGADWATFEMLDKNEDGTEDGFLLQGSAYAIQRDVDQNDATLRRYRRPDGHTFLRLSTQDWIVAEGFSNAYQLEDPSHTYAPQNVAQRPYTRIVHDGDGASAATGVVWEQRPDPVTHDMFLTYRVFADWPFMEMVLSATVTQGQGPYWFSSSEWNGRLLYLCDDFDRMVSDTRGDEALEKVWDTDMRWLVVYDSASGRGVGWFLPARGVVRSEESEGEISLYDSYGYAADGKTVWRYLWMAATDKDTIVERFDAMQPGVTVSARENRDLNVVQPPAGRYYFPDDTLAVVVTTPGGAQQVSGTLTLADDSTLDVALSNTENPLVWTAVAPLVLTTEHPEGTWVFRATAEPDAEQQATFEFRLPHHPKLFFDASELAALQARKDDPAYDAIWSDMVQRAEHYEPPLAEVGEGIDVRAYADRLFDLGLIQLVDPDQPFADLMWSYFFTMLRYPNWSDPDDPFNNHDLTVGHFLTALAAVYDWHYDALTATERREVRTHLQTVADDWLDSSWMRIYRDIDWHRFGSVTNNHYWINHQGVAAAAYVLAEEMDPAQRARWTEHLEENLAIILSVLEPDGTSNEGVAYHSYGQINLFRWLDMRDQALGENTIQDAVWFAESVWFDLYSVLPGGADNYGGIANFGDCPTRHYQPPRTIQAFLAARLQNGTAQWMAEQLAWRRTTAMSYLWYEPTVDAVAPDTLPTWRLFSHKGIFAWRSSWQNDAAYFSLKCGSYFGGHEQPDAGHFILHRAGVPYVVDLGYSYLKMSDEHNLILADGVGQHGEGTQWMSAVDPVHWAQVERALAAPTFFDLVADPGPMMRAADLQEWKREVVGLGGGVWAVRDTVSATTTMTFDWLLHSYVSEPPANENATYRYLEHRTEDPFVTVADRRWDIVPQTDASPLHLADVSHSAWTATIEPTMFVPEQNPDTHEYNSDFDSFEMGRRLRRTIESAQSSSVMVLWFGADAAVEDLSGGAAEGFRLYDGQGDLAVVFWPAAGGVSGFFGFDATGAMAGRRLFDPAYFGRALSALAADSQTLVEATAPIDVFARLEHTRSPTDPGSVVVYAPQETVVSLYCPQEPTAVSVEGTPLAFDWSAALLTITVPAGESRLRVE